MGGVANLNEISMLLGELRSDAKHIVRWAEEHEERDTERFQVLTEQLSAIAVPLQRLSILERELATAKPAIEFLNKAKWIVAGGLAVLAIMGGAASGLAAQALKWFV